jgi:hypothetical protein
MCHLLKVNCHPSNGTLKVFKDSLISNSASTSLRFNSNFELILNFNFFILSISMFVFNNI